MAPQDVMRTVEAAAERLKAHDPKTASFIDFDLLNDEMYEKFHPFAMMGKDQIAGLRVMPPGGREKVMYGIENNKSVVLDLVRPGKFIGYIPPNAPHHLTKEFGWWHLNGTEEFYFTIPLSDGNVCLIIFEANPPDRIDTFAWYCQKCLDPLHARTSKVGKVGLDGYWVDEAAAIEEFNGNEALRTCKECGTVHPLAYSVFDAPEKKVW